MSAAVIRAASRLFRVQYVSDLHLEFYDKLAFPLLLKPAAKYLALAGDICQPHHRLFEPFMRYVAGAYDQVFYIAGNHEYYQDDKAKWKYVMPQNMFEIQASIHRALKPFPNIHFLHHDAPSYYLVKENVAIVGSTLWSHIPPHKKTEALLGMNDFRHIALPNGFPEGVRSLEPDDVNLFHEREKRALDHQIDYWSDMGADIVVITHHMPSHVFMSYMYKDYPLNCCFASNSEKMMRRNVRAWVYGHTHSTCSSVVNNVLCVANARGYPNQKILGYNPQMWLEISMTTEEKDTKEEELVGAAHGISAIRNHHYSSIMDVAAA
jgi:predicted phosphodiesterase